MNLLNKIPEQLLYKVVPLSQNEKINKGNIEVVVLFGNKLDKVTRSVEAIGGVFEDLGYGFGIVTVKSEDIRKISALEGVQYVELPKVLFTSDFESNKACCVPNAWDRYGLTGEGVLVGFIDTGIDYTHPAFRDEDGNTRIDFIYDVAEDRKVYDKAQINEALKAPDPYAIVNVRDPLNHGTHVAGIACAGGKIPKQNYGVAFKSSIAMVKTTRYGFLNFALSSQIMRGIKFLVDKSNEMNKPLTINISLSTNDGAHNGTSLLEQYIETICRLERVSIVIAAGNEGTAAHHVGGELSDVNVIPLSVSDDEMALSLQLYKPLLVDMSIEIENPLGEKSGEIVLRDGYRELNIGVDKCLIYNTGPKPFDINGEISISLLPGLDYLPSGEWKLTLKVLNKYRGIYDIWLPITEAINEKTRFLKPDVYNTLGIPATVQSAISVGSYNNMTNTFSSFSGRGELYKTSFAKPDIVAPGEDILSTVSQRGFDTKTGTSMAAPHVAGICALLLEWGIVKGNDPFLYGDRIKYYLSKGAKRDRLELPYPDPSWGYGTVCAYDSLNLLKLANVRGYSRLEENITDEEFFTLLDTVFTTIEYKGDIASTISKIPNARIFIADKNRAILAVRGDVQEVIDKLFDLVGYVNPSVLYTLCDISPVEACGATAFHNSIYLPLDGMGVTVGIVGTGIDYLNEEFINEDNTSRILTIWDQTIASGKKPEGQFGRISQSTSATIEYQGDITSSVKKVPNARVFILDERRAIVVAEGDLQEVLDKLSDVIIQVIPNLTGAQFVTLPHSTFSTIEYQGDIASIIKEIPNARISIIDKKRAILIIVGDIQDIEDVLDKLTDVSVYQVPTVLHTLCDISPVDASGANAFHNSIYLPLDGLGVTVGIVDTGIDYLNEEFINEDGTSRILSIWDQEISSGKSPEGQFGGSEYTREEINKAIKAKKEGQDPYKIVPSKDEMGHGTSMASIIGARGANPAVIGVAPKCNFAIVKLVSAPLTVIDDFGMYGNVTTYSTSVVFSGIKYLYDLSRRLKTPMVILVPLGANLGPHNGLSFIERYIDEISKVSGITVVVPIGNQGDSDTHTSGIIVKKGDTQDIELKIDKNQKNIKFEIWVNKPDKFALSITSPSGEIIQRIPPRADKITEIKFIYESTIIYVQYSIPEVSTGEQLITIKARNIREGIWIFKLIGELVVTGRYDAYLIQRELLAPGTKFLSPDPYVTLTIPSSSSYAISVGYYNQNNNSTVRECSRGYTRDDRIKPDVVAGGVNALVVAVGSGTQVVSGSSVAAAVVAGCCALIFEWGIIDGNDTSLYSTKVKTYLIGGTSKREGDIYPNPQWGYGAVDMRGVFNNIRLKLNELRGVNDIFMKKPIDENEYYVGNLFIRLPI